MIINQEFYIPLSFEKLSKRIIVWMAFLKQPGSVNHVGLLFLKKIWRNVVQSANFWRRWQMNCQECCIATNLVMHSSLLNVLATKEDAKTRKQSIFWMINKIEVKTITFAQPQEMMTKRQRKIGSMYQGLLLLSKKNLLDSRGCTLSGKLLL